MNICKDDQVQVISGNDKGKWGRVFSVIKDKRWVFVEGIRMMMYYIKFSVCDQQGGIIEWEMLIHVSNLMIVCFKMDVFTCICKKQFDSGKYV